MTLFWNKSKNMIICTTQPAASLCVPQTLHFLASRWKPCMEKACLQTSLKSIPDSDSYCGSSYWHRANNTFFCVGFAGDVVEYTFLTFELNKLSGRTITLKSLIVC